MPAGKMFFVLFSANASQYKEIKKREKTLLPSWCFEVKRKLI
jgi:hypothetical protein